MSITVACKLPNGLQIEHANRVVTLNGAHHPNAVAGFGMTHDVDEEWFKDWAAKHPKFPPLANGSIFAASTVTNAADAAKERTDDDDVQTGLEPLDADSPAPGIEPTDETKKELEKTADKRARTRRTRNRSQG